MSYQREHRVRLPPRRFVRLIWYAHRGLYRVTAGRVGLWRPKRNRWGTLRLTTGRHTGRARSVMLDAYAALRSSETAVVILEWVRAYVGETAVVDSRAPMLFYEDSFPVPGYAFGKSDVRTDLLRPSAEEPAGGHFFFLSKGPVVQWFDLEVEGRLIPHAAWIRDEAELRDLLVFSWQPGGLGPMAGRG